MADRLKVRGKKWTYPVGNACTGVQQSVFMAERSGDTLGWKLKCWLAERSRSMRFFWWELRNDFQLLSYVFVRMREAPWQTSRMKSRDALVPFDIH